MRAGVDCYMSSGTANILKLSGHRMNIIESMKQFKIGTWTILPFDTIHDAAEPLGFLLASGNEKLLFATDTAYIKYRFKGLTHIMVECNYDDESLQENIFNLTLNIAQKNRLIHSHFGLKNVIEFLKVNDLSKLKEIHLLHLSDLNSDAARIKKAVQAITGKPVYVA